VLSTVHAERGVDAVPVVYALVHGLIVVPVDTVKPKRSFRLGRMANVARDPRCVLLVDHYSENWSDLWWVRVHARASVAAPEPGWVQALADRYPPYRAPGAVVAIMALQPTAIFGWSAEAAGAGRDGPPAELG
jgi:PPOX class probable F420-dependent enzyme